jgi:hypothetical protein
MRPFAASCQRQIRHFHSFIRVFACFSRFLTALYNFCGNFRPSRVAHPERSEARITAISPPKKTQNSGLRGLAAFTSGRFNNPTSGAAARK